MTHLHVVCRSASLCLLLALGPASTAFAGSVTVPPVSGDATAILSGAIQTAISSAGPAEVVLGAGTYQLACAGKDLEFCLTVSGAQNGITIRGQGIGVTQLRIGNPLAAFLMVTGSKNVVLSQFDLDYTEVPFTQGVVKAVGNGTPKYLDVQIEAGYPTFEHSMFAPNLLAATFGMLFSASSPSMKGDAGNYYYISSVSKLPSGYFRVNLGTFGNSVNAAVNDRFAVPVRAGKPTLYFHQNSGITLSDVTVYTGTNLGSGWQENDGPILIDRFSIRRKPGTTRLLSTAADAIHMVDNRGRLVIRNSYIEGMGDDAINTRATALSVSQVAASNRLSFRRLDGAGGEISLPPGLAVGQTVQVVNTSSQAPRGAARIRSLEVSGNTATVTLDRAIAGAVAGDSLMIAEMASSYALISKNTFSNFRGMLRVRSRAAVFQDNSFLDARNAKIFIAADINPSWKEGPSLVSTLERPVFSGNTVTGGKIQLLGVGYANLGNPTQGIDQLRTHPLVYNPAFYRAMNPSLANRTDAQLRTHWLNTGIAGSLWASPDFNVNQYMELHPDIGAFYQTDRSGALLHFVTWGAVGEGRQGTIAAHPWVFRPAEYAAYNPSLGSKNDTDLAADWLLRGLSAGLRGSAEFHSVLYFGRYQDLRDAYGATNYLQAVWHYVRWGKSEGRIGN